MFEIVMRTQVISQGHSAPLFSGLRFGIQTGGGVQRKTQTCPKGPNPVRREMPEAIVQVEPTNRLVNPAAGYILVKHSFFDPVLASLIKVHQNSLGTVRYRNFTISSSPKRQPKHGRSGSLAQMCKASPI